MKRCKPDGLEAKPGYTEKVCLACVATQVRAEMGLRAGMGKVRFTALFSWGNLVRVGQMPLRQGGRPTGGTWLPRPQLSVPEAPVEFQAVGSRLAEARPFQASTQD